jgi:hypothetical protein
LKTFSSFISGVLSVTNYAGIYLHVNGRETATQMDVSGTVSSLEIIVDDLQIGQGRRPPVRTRFDDPPAHCRRRFVLEIGGGFENGPGRIEGSSILLRWFNAPVRCTTLFAEAFGWGSAKRRYASAKCDRVHGR